ncbi:MAG: ATP-binding protein [Bacteroidales bacterium]
MVANRFRNKIFLYYSLLFALFAGITLTYQYHREKNYRISNLNTSLDDIVNITNAYLNVGNLPPSVSFESIDSLIGLFPYENLRITIIAGDGTVLYDNFVEDWSRMENHSSRPEILEAARDGKGSEVRVSGSTGEKHYYYAKKFDNYFLRAALIYDIRTIRLLKTGAGYIIAMAVLFMVAWFFLLIISEKFSKSITLLRDFAIETGRNRYFKPGYTFPNNELGTIGREITQIYNNLLKTRDELAMERERLFSHLSALNEGVAFYSPERELILANQQFSQFLNIISEDLNVTANDVLIMDEFLPVKDFINENIAENRIPFEIPVIECQVMSGAKFFSVKCIMFADKSFEIIITDITKAEKNRRIKQQMTSNLAHELKTPVTSVIGYLETLLEYDTIETCKRRAFLEKATIQANRLAVLINDLVTLNKIEEANGTYQFERVNISALIDEVRDNFILSLSRKNMNLINEANNDIEVMGNKSLLLSIFQNLVENSVNYAGDETTIRIICFKSEAGFHHFSFSDDGSGVPCEHLNRIFERFYRIDSGRSREDGGTGLGLSIVKNAVLLHKGDISARLHHTGGLEFLFMLPSAIRQG